MRPLAALGAIVLIPTGSAHGAPASQVKVAAFTQGHRQTTSVAVGQHWVARATIAPYAADDVLTVVVARGRSVVASVTSKVVRDAGGASGHVAVPVRLMRAGDVVIWAGQHASSTSAGAEATPVIVSARTIGRPRPGCRPAAEIVSAGRDERGIRLYPGARVPRRVVVRRSGARYAAARGRLMIGCRDVVLRAGAVRVSTRRGRLALRVGHGRVVSVGGRVRLTARAAPSRVLLLAGRLRATSTAPAAAPLVARVGDRVLFDRVGLPRLDTWPFARSPDDRPARAGDRLPAFWADGAPCSTGCRPAGAIDGWPLRPFHAQHALRAGLNELRGSNFHIGVDIQALDGTPVYAIQSGVARVDGIGTVDERVQVGNYIYWHVRHRVRPGEYVRAYHTVVGRIVHGAGHLHFSEVVGQTFLNPLRPGGRVLSPWRDAERPVIGLPRAAGHGDMFVEVFDPQSYRRDLGYRTPVLAPAAVAYRAADRAGHFITPLEFAYRGSRHLPDGQAWSVYGRDSHRPDHNGHPPDGWGCFFRWEVCVPRWDYRLAGGLAPPLPPGAASVTVYAWDWAGNVGARRVLLLRSPHARTDALGSVGG